MTDKNKGAPPVWVTEGTSVRVAYDLGASEILLKVGDCFKVEVFQGESEPAIHRLTGFKDALGKRVGPAQIKYQEWNGVDWGEERTRTNFWYCDMVTKMTCPSSSTKVGGNKPNKKKKSSIKRRLRKKRRGTRGV
jgi:hypothetical protein